MFKAKRSLLGLSLLVVTPLSAFAADLHGVHPLSASKMIRGFKLSLDKSGAVKASGLLPKGCEQSIKITIEDLQKDREGKLIYPVTVASTEDASCISQAAECTRDKCTDLSVSSVDGLISAASGAVNVTSMNGSAMLLKTGELMYKFENLSVSALDEEAVKYSKIGDGLLFKDNATLAAEQEEQDKLTEAMQMAELCDLAESGDRDAIDQLKDMGASKEFLAELNQKAAEKDVADFNNRIMEAKSLKEIQALQKSLNAYSKAHPEADEAMAEVHLTLVSRIRTLDVFGAFENTPKQEIFMTQIKSLEKARELDYSVPGTRVTLNATRLDYLNWAAQTGDAMTYSSASVEGRKAMIDLTNMSRNPTYAQAANSLLDSQKPSPIEQRSKYEKVWKYDGSVIINTKSDELYYNAREAYWTKKEADMTKQQQQIIKDNGVTTPGVPSVVSGPGNF